MDNRNVFLRKALEEIPKLLTLLDRNPHSPTFGCFDRNFWHYKIIDFPSGMAQEFVYPLALAYDTNSDLNPYYGKSVIRDWVHAGIAYAATNAHKDGSCDDYYPFERASGAAAFSLLGFTESYRLLKLSNPRFITFFKKRADWLADHFESGRLSNHQALITLCLELVGRTIHTDRWATKIHERLNSVLSWQNDEGWFQEYEGFDPGYHTLTVLLLAWIHQFKPEDQRLKHAITKGIEVALEFSHPDGSFGGEYGSRNTNNYFSYGFELAGQWKPEALYLNDQFSKAISANITPCYSDDHIIGHHIWDYFLTYSNYVTPRRYEHIRKSRFFLREGKMLVDRREDTEIYIALNKGGVFKVFKKNKLVCADTGFSVIIKTGKKQKNAVAHLVDNYDIDVDENTISIQGKLGWAKQSQMDSCKFILLRLIMFTIGRFCPNFIRKILQALLITGKKRADLSFKRQFTWQSGAWNIEDRLATENWNNIKDVCIGSDQTSIYVVMSRTFHIGQLFPSIDLHSKLNGLGPGQELIFKRVIE
ncbi:MAG: hypothetical protein WAU91_09420 [Desulfatitalea sp.]